MTMHVKYDSIGYNSGILLDLPFTEGTGTLIHDVAKPHHTCVTQNGPTWTTLSTGKTAMTFDGINQYCEEEVMGSTADLDFTVGDYSLACWINWIPATTHIILGRYELFVSGWEWYVTDNGGGLGTISLRHSHAGGTANRSSCFSIDWTANTWQLMSISRVGATAQHYRNGVAVTTTYGVGGLENPETCAQDLVIGTRFSKTNNFWKGGLAKPRVWGRALSATEWKTMYELEKDGYP
jgi:hypothetical protein